MKRAGAIPDDRWIHAGGDLEAAVRAQAASGRLGAYIEILVEPLGTFVAGDLTTDLKAAWEAMTPLLPVGAVARREGWFSIGAVVAGDPGLLVELARSVMRVLTARKRMPPYRAAALICEIRRDDPEAALLVDASNAIEDTEGDVVGWAKPYRLAPGRPDVDCDVDWIGMS